MAGSDHVRQPSAGHPWRAGLLIAVSVLAVDQVSKWWILSVVMNPPRVLELTPFFNLVLVHNEGVSFGLFADGGAGGRWLLSAIALMVVGVLAVWMGRAESQRTAWALGSLIGGALGNVIDRLVHGAVIDFLDLHVGGWHWPAFNVADSAIVIGAALLVFESFLTRRD